MFLLSFGTKFDNSTLLVVEKIAILDLVGLCKFIKMEGCLKSPIILSKFHVQ